MFVFVSDATITTNGSGVSALRLTSYGILGVLLTKTFSVTLIKALSANSIQERFGGSLLFIVIAMQMISWLRFHLKPEAECKLFPPKVVF